MSVAKTPWMARVRDVGACFVAQDYQEWKRLYGSQSIFVILDHWLIGWLWIPGLQCRQFCVLRIESK